MQDLIFSNGQANYRNKQRIQDSSRADYDGRQQSLNNPEERSEEGSEWAAPSG